MSLNLREQLHTEKKLFTSNALLVAYSHFWSLIVISGRLHYFLYNIAGRLHYFLYNIAGRLHYFLYNIAGRLQAL